MRTNRSIHAITASLLSLWFLSAVGTLCGADDGGDATDDQIEEFPIESFDRNHWSFLPVDDPAVPKVVRVDWPQTAIDHFVLHRLEAESLQPARPASRETLLRRVCFDLTGLPPTPAQIDAFLSDSRPDAYERLVDRLLASPEFGQRMAQPWLDLARFAETDGFEHDKVRPTAWKYRDWVIDALAADMPYDQFVRWQIAGDQLAPPEHAEEGRIATAFCLSGPDMPDINSQEERKHVLMNEVTSTVGAVLLSLQIGCAQCHDHKYDMISQADFYRLRAFFDPAVRMKKNESVTTLSAGADAKATSHLMIRGDWRRQGPQLNAAFPRIANPNGADIATYSSSGSGRAALARWLTEPDHPLTPRTIVNRVWQHHFGRGLSATPSDFGVMGEEPTHPELLEYLASRLIESGWSLKRLHRQIVLSSVYRTRSDQPHSEEPDQQYQHWLASLQADPENELLSRFPRRRLEAESLRDAMFAVSGTLVHQQRGPGVQPPLPPEMIKTLKSGQWKTSENKADHYRQSIYIFARRNLRYPFFATFDRPAANASCAMRHPSTTAVQSLLLFNSTTTMDAAQRLAADIRRKIPADRSAQCDELYRRLFTRQPSEEESRVCIEFLAEQAQMLANEKVDESGHEAFMDLCRALLNSNEFLYID